MKKKILVVKRKKDDVLKFKVTEKVNRGYSDTEYNNSIMVSDYKQLALLFGDLKLLFNAPIEKAVVEMRKKKKDPFW